ncbi:MAG: hypothetical protein KatS3mg070_1598 [Meiothermus sp.]|uniref:hypothetical protein n=1 Tax=Meiothermus sp. TaxID=1955249 RepID=UPI0021DD8D46|nr:hypothetical protein [Meiothermus sp.]GIW28235.1 MAG: hypothetical protein KatS3mg070_1598 [Meiothermus sp.]
MYFEQASTIYDRMYIEYRKGTYTRGDFETDWPQLLELARQNRDWELLQGVSLILPAEWWEDKFAQAIKEF